MLTRSLLVIFNHSPYGSATSKDALDFVMAAGSYGFEVSALFIEDGVLQFIQTDTSTKDTPYSLKNTAKVISSFEFFEIEPVYACQASTLNRNINADQLSDQIKLIDSQQISEIVKQADFVVTL